MNQIQEYKNPELDLNHEEFVVVYYDAGIPELDEHIRGTKQLDGLLYSKEYSLFICETERFNQIDKELRIREKSHNYDVDCGVYESLGSYLSEGGLLQDDIDLSIPFGYGEDIEFDDLREFGDNVAYRYEKISDFDSKDWALSLIKEVKLLVLDYTLDDLTTSINDLKKSIVEGHE